MRNNELTVVRNSVYIWIRLVITTCINLFLTRYVLLKLGETDFGIYAVIGSIVTIMGFINTVMVSSSNRFIAFEIGKNQKSMISEVVVTCLFIHVLIAIIILIFGFFIGEFYISEYLKIPIDKLNQAIVVFRVSLIGAAISFVFVPFNGLLIAFERFAFLSFIRILSSFFRLFLVLIILNYIKSDHLIYYSYIMSVVLLVPGIMCLVYSLCRFNICCSLKINKSLMFRMLSFSIWVSYGAFATMTKTQGASLLINRFLGVLVNSSMGIASSINGILIMFNQSLIGALTPQIVKSYARGDVDTAFSLVIKASRFSFLILFISSFPIYLTIDDILVYWLTDVPPYTSQIIKLMIIDLLIRSSNTGVPQLIFASGEIRTFQIIDGTLVLLSLPVALLALKLNAEPYMLFGSYIFMTCVTVFIRQFVLYNKFKIDVFRFMRESYYFSLVVLTVSVLIVYFIEDLRILNNPLIYFFTVLIILIMVSLFLGLNKNERHFLFNILKSRII